MASAKERFYKNQLQKGKITQAQYNKTMGTSAAPKTSSKSSSKSSSSDYKDVIASIMGNTPAQQKVLPDFETTYTPALQTEDQTQSEALYTPYFQKQIANQLEDLNAWSASENTNYDRSLRRARATLAAGGGAIGTERTTQEDQMAADEKTATDNAVRTTERAVGTDAIKNAGYQSAGQTQEGDLVGKMKSAIAEGALWYKNQRAQRYYGDANTYYSQPTDVSLAGTNM